MSGRDDADGRAATSADAADAAPEADASDVAPGGPWDPALEEEDADVVSDGPHFPLIDVVGASAGDDSDPEPVTYDQFMALNNPPRSPRSPPARSPPTRGDWYDAVMAMACGSTQARRLDAPMPSPQPPPPPPPPPAASRRLDPAQTSRFAKALASHRQHHHRETT